MSIDAIILAGGRSSRLGGVPKSEFAYRGRSLIATAIAAVAEDRAVVVGPRPSGLPPYVLVTREDPPFTGPVAAIDAGLTALSANGSASEFTIVLGCDMPEAVGALAVLRWALPTDADGVIALDPAGERQPLAAIYRTTALRQALANRTGNVAGVPVFRLIDSLRLVPVPVPIGTTDDVDTWPDAEKFHLQHPSDERNTNMTEHDGSTKDDRAAEDAALAEWSKRVTEALEIGDLQIDINSVLGLAGRAAHTVLRPAAPLTTFIVGYAAGLAAAAGTPAREAMKSALDVGYRLCRQQQAALDQQAE